MPNNNIRSNIAKIKRSENSSQKLKYEEPFKKFLIINNIDFIQEFCPIPNRKFRADFYLKKYNVLIEIEGGIWNQGRHTRGFGYANDVRKYNDYMLAGYRLIRFTSDDFMAITKYDYYIKDYIKTTIEKITGETIANRTL
jgi:very-short-patch-repair endonuclease